MKFGVQMFPTDYAIPVTELGKAAEDLALSRGPVGVWSRL